MKDVMLAGIGNIGLPLAPLIARQKGIRSILLVDPDDYTQENIFGQLISSSAAGATKVNVAAERIAGISSSVEITRWKSRLEQLPRGLFRARVILSALDTRASRAALSHICFAAGSELWLDAGVRAQNRMARVSVVFPNPAEPEPNR